MNYKYGSYVNGNVVYSNDGKNWFYEDGIKYDMGTGKPSRPCPRCGGLPTKDGYDHCLGYIEGAVSACCMHGEGKGYIIFKDGRRVEI